ncbi:MAG: hypothetical protein GX303_03400 [Clostridiales bacterium]|nr:hypothetical protein [Clostridiales bacterium]
MKKTILALLCLVLLISCVACGGGDPALSSESTDENSPDENPSSVQIISEGTALYQIVRADEAGKDVKEVVSAFHRKIKEKTGVELKIKTDWLGRGEERDPGAKEILIGITNYEESQRVLDSINYNDYAIKIEGSKIVIIAHNTTMLQRAVNYYVSTLSGNLTLDDEGRAVSLTLSEYVYTGDYPINSIALAGRELRDYRIVYDEGSVAAKEAAEELKKRIAAVYPAVLPVVGDSAPATEGEILIGRTNRPESEQYYTENDIPLIDYRILVKGGKLLFCAGGNYAIGRAPVAFGEKFLLLKKDKVAIDDNMTLSSAEQREYQPLAEGADLRIMTANILAEKWGGTPEAMRSELFDSVLRSYLPDVVGLQEIADEWTDLVESAFDGKYAYVHAYTPEKLQNYSTMIYRQDKFSVIESGVYYFKTHKLNNIRLVTWAVFERKSDSVRFAVFNTHWSFDSVQVQIKHAEEMFELIDRVCAKYDVPVFCTGDFNAKPSTDSYKRFVELTGLSDVRVTAEINVNPEVCGTHPLGVKNWNGENNIDHIFASKDIKALKFETIVGNAVVDLSDHCPRYADFALPKQ